MESALQNESEECSLFIISFQMRKSEPWKVADVAKKVQGTFRAFLDANMESALLHFPFLFSSLLLFSK